MLFVKLAFIIFNIFCFFYIFLNIFANINSKRILFNKILKILTKIIATNIYINFLIKEASFSIVLTKIKVRF